MLKCPFDINVCQSYDSDHKARKGTNQKKKEIHG